MNIAGLNKCDIANGDGIRVSIFVSGCDHHCPGCFNQEAWDYGYGTALTDETIENLITYVGRPWVSGITILGGEPLEPCNQEEVLKLMKAVKEAYPAKTIWLYTGFILEDLLYSATCRANTAVLADIMELVDVLVDGPYVEDLRDPTLRFRGSSNQRIINMNTAEVIAF